MALVLGGLIVFFVLSLSFALAASGRMSLAIIASILCIIMGIITDASEWFVFAAICFFVPLIIGGIKGPTTKRKPNKILKCPICKGSGKTTILRRGILHGKPAGGPALGPCPKCGGSGYITLEE